MPQLRVISKLQSKLSYLRFQLNKHSSLLFCKVSSSSLSLNPVEGCCQSGWSISWLGSSYLLLLFPSNWAIHFDWTLPVFRIIGVVQCSVLWPNIQRLCWCPKCTRTLSVVLPCAATWCEDIFKPGRGFWRFEIFMVGGKTHQFKCREEFAGLMVYICAACLLRWASSPWSPKSSEHLLSNLVCS